MTERACEKMTFEYIVEKGGTKENIEKIKRSYPTFVLTVIKRAAKRKYVDISLKFPTPLQLDDSGKCPGPRLLVIVSFDKENDLMVVDLTDRIPKSSHYYREQILPLMLSPMNIGNAEAKLLGELPMILLSCLIIDINRITKNNNIIIETYQECIPILRKRARLSFLHFARAKHFTYHRNDKQLMSRVSRVVGPSGPQPSTHARRDHCDYGE